jgi:hypothetical protein
LAPPVASPAANSTPHNPRNFISASLQAEAFERSPACTLARIVRRTDIKE